MGVAGATFIARVAGAGAGIVSAHPVAGDEATIELVSMWTAPEHRRAGVGRGLVDAVVRWAQSRDAARVVLWVVRGNDAARAFYESVGFRATDEIAPLPSDPCRHEQRMVRDLSDLS